MLRLIGYFFGIGAVMALLLAVGVAVYLSNVTKDLPDYEVLNSYEPPVTTRVHAGDGSLMAEYARERRLYLPIQAVPDRVKAAFLSAEDKNFYNHRGVDIVALARAMTTNLRNYGSDRRPVGASTITQQVAKNFLLTSDQTIDRKIKEAVLSFRMEQAYSKDRIFELYLNEIFFGFNAYGIAGAALTYFDKSVNELTIAESAYLASLPKAPNNYHPFRQTERAIERRNWVIDRMAENGYVSKEDAQKARQDPLGVNVQRGNSYLFASEYFAEEVRREIMQRYGEDALYEGGLSVRTSLDPNLQRVARRSLQNGLIGYDEGRGYRGPVTTIEIGDDWGKALFEVEPLSDVPEWKLAVVLATDGEGADVGLRPKSKASGAVGDDRETGRITADNMKWAYRMQIDGKASKAGSPADVLSVGDVVYVQDREDGLRLRQPPEVQGGMVAMNPDTGRVLAMVGGFSFGESEFNRATQAYRQPGSAFKPFVYAAALDNGYTPASVILDAPVSIVSGGEVWEPKNYGGGAAGPSTLRLGIEKSRNLMTVRLAKDMGMNLVAEYAERFGVYDEMAPLLAMSLGSGETTVLRMVSAYSVIANGGKQIKPSMIDRIQDRYGKTIFKHDERVCDACNAETWMGQDEPELVDNRTQVLDPMTAYQITSMMEGVVKRGTATSVSALGRPVAGKTGTTNDEKDAWFMGFTPDLVVGVYLGFDNPKPMGRGSTGGKLAAPVFLSFMQKAMENRRPLDFTVPEGLNLIAINRKTGMRSSPGGADVIMEAFKPGTGPADTFSVIGMEQIAEKAVRAPPSTISNQVPPKRISNRAKKSVNRGSGGLY